MLEQQQVPDPMSEVVSGLERGDAKVKSKDKEQSYYVEEFDPGSG